MHAKEFKPVISHAITRTGDAYGRVKVNSANSAPRHRCESPAGACDTGYGCGPAGRGVPRIGIGGTETIWIG